MRGRGSSPPSARRRLCPGGECRRIALLVPRCRGSRSPCPTRLRVRYRRPWSLTVQPRDVAIRGSADGGGTVVDHDTTPPAAVDTIEAETIDATGDVQHGDG